MNLLDLVDMESTQWVWNVQWVWNFEKNIENVLRNFLRKFEKVSRKPCINGKDNRKSSKFNYTVIDVARTMKFLAVVNQPYIYQNKII